MDWKNMFSALLGFSAVLFLELPQAQFLTRGGSKYVPLFIIVLISQVLLEIFAKYQGKMCDTIEGLFTATIALLGFLVGNALANRAMFGGFSGDFGTTAQYSYQASGTGIGGPILLTAVIVGLFLFIWKAWLRPKLGMNIQGCNPQGGPGMITRQVTTTVQIPEEQRVVEQAPPPPPTAESFGGYY